MPKLATETEDDWETDPDYVNDVTEESQRWGGARDTGQSFSELDQRNFIWTFFPLFDLDFQFNSFSFHFIFNSFFIQSRSHFTMGDSTT